MSQARADSGQGLERLPPQAVEVEKAVLGAMLIDPRAVGRALEVLGAEGGSFYHDPHGRIYQAMIALYERNEVVDQLTVSEELKRRQQLDAAGGVVYLASLAAEVATSANVEYHARIVLDRALSRRLIETAGQISAQAYEGRAEVQQLIDWAEQQIFSLSERRLSQGFESLENVLQGTFEQIEQAHRQISSVTGVDTGFADLNEKTAGFQKGELIILAARPSVGKSALALCMARNAAMGAGVGVAIFTLEMSKIQLAQRLLCIETRLNLQHLRTGRLREEDWLNLTRNIGRLSQAPIYIDDTAGISVLEARAKARRLKREKGIGMVIIDYLQLMSTHENIPSREQEISRISRGLKALAKELDVPVLALSQLSRAVESRSDRRPQLSDLRESGCLTGDTLVARADTGERVPIRELVGIPNVLVWALNPATHKLEKVLVSNAFCTGAKPTFRLTTRLGRTIRATANHKFLTLEGWRRLDELATGQHVALPRHIPPPARQTMTDAELALLGHLIGDGCVLPRHAVQYTTCSTELANKVVSLAHEIFGDQLRPHVQKILQQSQVPLYQVFLSAAEHLTHNKKNPVVAWFAALGIVGLRSYQKRVPAEVFRQPERAVALFLRHLWATDGAIKMESLPRIYYASSSRRLAGDVQSLLLRLGINARLKRVPQPGKGRDQHHVILSGRPDVECFVERIGTVGAYREEELGKIRHYLEGRQSNTNRDIIPRSVWQSLAKPAMRRLGMTGRQMQQKLGNQYCGASLYKNHLSRERASRLARVVESTELALLAASDLYWDEIVSIVPDEIEEVFDLTVPGLHNFIADDLVVHNSIEQDADMVMFIYRPELYGLKAPDGGSLEGIAEVIIGKQRNGPTGSVQLMWNPECAAYDNLAPEWRVEPEGQY
jgi:replicative DNA helicase